ncbi:hypothetical protein [Microbacterium sp. SA39]|uniref:hypothetical protein n=1 Tax=Microbacterium sp. SA39 TaxID=1263625 RepID=UPI0005FA5BAD|nr:hypothetical protein [Microbacterium sp. SA39]KJQ54613.1 hypothetical protein RS85_01767 [Microbacterium sp. SA39]
MTSVTFLGAGGGTGTTTLAALSVLLLAENGARVPAVVAENSAAFDRRLGTLPAAARAGGNELVDGGGYRAGKASSALAQGRLVIVGAPTPQGISSLELALSDIASRFGGAGLERTQPVLVAAFGAPSGQTPGIDIRVRIPFDPSLAPGGRVSDALPALRGRTRAALRQQWLPWLLDVYGGR